MTVALRDRLARVAAARRIITELEWKAAGAGSEGGQARRDDEVEGSRLSYEAAKPMDAGETWMAAEGERRDPRQRRHPASPPFSVSESRHEIGGLGLEIVGRGEPDPLTLAHLGLRGEPPRRWEDIVFLDTETTGLSGGTGTYVFLLGTAWIEGTDLVLRQHLLRRLGGEREFVAAMRAELEAFRACASYNGKAFDLPILRTRVVLALRGDLSVDESHLDLLHPARRLWKDRFGSTTLRQLEASILDEPRGGDDVPGWEIPDVYFRYLRSGDDRVLAPVLRHNARDVVSLVRIADRVARAVVDARRGRVPDHAPAALALARVFERGGESDAAFWCWESAYVEGDAVTRVRAALPFARALERRGEVDRAITMLEALVAMGRGTPAWRVQAEARMRRLSRLRWRRRQLPAAS